MSRCADLLFETLAVFDVRIRHCDNMTENRFKKNISGHLCRRSMQTQMFKLYKNLSIK